LAAAVVAAVIAAAAAAAAVGLQETRTYIKGVYQEQQQQQWDFKRHAHI
jgi:hypothetical protein